MDETWIATALAVTAAFETADDPFAAVTGDFDGEGLSCGALQWNVGQGTLQPLVKRAGEAAVMAHMPIHGAAFWAAMAKPIPETLADVRAWQAEGRLDPAFAQELAGFLGSPEMRREQRAAARTIAQKAFAEAERWAASRGATPSQPEFCWFFDCVTQNGGLKGLGLADVRAFIAGNPAPETAICDWLRERAPPEFATRDCRRNAALWRGATPDQNRDLFVLSYLRALKCASQSRGAVMNRKGTLATMRGWVNGRLIDLSPKFLTA